MTSTARLRVLVVRALPVAPALLAAIAFGWLPALRRERGDFCSGAVWGLVLLVAYVGWGRVFLRWLWPGRKAGWGLDGAMGLALSIAAGGLLMMIHAARSVPILLWVIGGVIGHAIVSFREAPAHRATALRRATRMWNAWVAYALFTALFAIRYLGAVANISFNQWDDNMAYRGFARQILDTGTLVEPFSYHRMGSYCGQSFLHAMALVLSGPTRLHIVDEGIGMLLLVGLVVGYRGKHRVAGIVCALALLVTLPYETHNIQSALTGVVMFLALFRVLDTGEFAEGKLTSNALAVGVLAAAVCTLRQNYMVAAAGTLAVFYGSLIMSRSKERRRWSLEGLAVAFVTCAALVPWAVISYESAHTFLYPVMRGTTNPDFGILGKVSRFEELRWIIDNVTFSWPVRTISLFVLAGLIAVHHGRIRALHALLAGTMLGFFALIHFFQAFHLADSLGRYYLAFSLAYALAITLKVPSEAWRGPRLFAPLAIVMASLVVQVFDVRDKATHLYTNALDDIEDELRDRVESIRANDLKSLKAADFYQRMQATIPEGQRVLIMVDETYRFDGARNPVWNFDQPGALSPAPGVPYFQGDEAYATYFTSIGVRYLAFVVSESSPEYSVTKWLAHVKEPEQKNGRGNMYRKQGVYYLDAFANFTALTHSRKVLFHENDYWVLDLQSRADG